MTGPRRELISGLVADLRPTPGPGRVAGLATLWLVGTFTLALLFTALTDPFRPGSAGQLVAHPRFGLETLLGVVAIVMLAANAFRAAIPGPGMVRRLLLPALSVTVLWLINYVLGLWAPALEPSLAGERRHCVLETLVYGLPPIFAGIYAIRRYWPVRGWISGLLLGLAAGLTPALIMQLACMYVPAHILSHHILPGLALGALGALLGHFLIRPRG